MNPDQHLRSFLRDRRALVSPNDSGLPSRPRSRISGLRQEDVAELLGVTPLWYALFESGTSGRRFSAAFVERLARVLRLTDEDRQTLIALVVESGHAASDLESMWRHRQLRVVLEQVVNVAAQLAEAAGTDHVVHSCVSSLHQIAASVSSVGYAPGSRSYAVAES